MTKIFPDFCALEEKSYFSKRRNIFRYLDIKFIKINLIYKFGTFKMTKTSSKARIFTYSSFLLGILVLGLCVTKLRVNSVGQKLSLQNREKRSKEKLQFIAEEGSGSLLSEGSGSDDIWISLIEELDGQSPVQLKKSGEKRARKEQREKTRNNRKLKRQQNRERNKVTGPKFLSLSRKSLARAEKRLKELWTDQAAEWMASNERSWEFGNFQNQELLEKLEGKLPDEFSGHPGHEDIAPAVNTLLETGRCSQWRGGERPMNLYFAVQNTVPLHANNKRSDFGLVMQFVSDLVSQIDLKTNKIKIFEYNENDTIGDPVFSASMTSNKRNNRNRQLKQLRKSTKSRPTIERPKIKPIVEKLNSVMDADKNTLMSGSTNVVILFITNIPGDLHNVDKDYLSNEIKELNSKAFVIVVFVHPMSTSELRTVPYRLLPKAWTHGLRDNEFAQRILVQKFSELSSNNNKPLVKSVKNMLCLVDERLQCRLSNKPWHDGQKGLQLRSTLMIDSCCGHEIASKAYDSQWKACCRDGSVKSWIGESRENPCGSNAL